MEESQRDAVGVVMQALSVLGSPSTTQEAKLGANEILAKVKASDLNTVLGIAIELIERECAEENLIFAYHLLSEVTQQKWHQCSGSQREGLATFASCMLKKGGQTNLAVQRALAHFSAVVLSRQNEDSLSTSWGHVLKFGEMEQSQRGMVCQMAQFLCEEGSSSANRTANERHALLSALTKLAVPTFQFLTQVAEVHYGICVQESEPTVREAHAKVVRTSLAAMETWCELVPLRRVGEGQVLRICQGLLTVDAFEVAVLGVLEKIVFRRDVNEADVPVGVDAGVLVMGHLRKYHDMHHQNALDLEDGEQFEKAFKTATALCGFAESFYQFFGKGMGRPDPQDVILEVLKVFDFRSIEINVQSLAFWKKFLSVKSESWRGFSAECVTGAHWMVPIAKNLGICLFQLKDLLQSVQESDVVLHMNDTLEEFKGRHSQVVSACMGTYTLLFPKIVIEYVGALLREAVDICNHPGANESARVVKMRTLAHAVGPVTLEQVAQMDIIPQMMAGVLEGIVSIKTVKDQVNLAYWLGQTVRAASRVVRMTEASCGVILPSILDILFELPMPTVGLGPRLDNSHSAALFDARGCLSGAIRQLVENSPESVRPHYAGFKEKIGQGNAAQRVTILEVTVFREVFILSSYSAPPALQKEVLDWAFGPVYASWSQKPWLRGHPNSPQNLASFLQCYMPIEGRHPNGEVLVGGCQNRWDLFHELLLISKVYSRHPRSVWHDRNKPPPTSAIDPLLELVAVVGNILRFVQDIFDPKNRGLLGCLEPILHLGREEMEALSGMTKGSRQKDEADESNRVGAPNLGSCRKWLTCVFDRSTRIFMMVGKGCPLFWTHDVLCQSLPPLVSGAVPLLDMRFRRLMLHQVVIPWMVTCPQWRRKVWIFPMLTSMLPSLRQALMEEWAKVSSKDFQQAQRTEFEEIVFDGLLREETVDTANLYISMCQQKEEESDEKTGMSVFEGLISWNPSSCEIVTKLCLDLLQVPDSRVINKMVQFAKFYVSLSASSKDLQTVVVGEMLHALLKLLFDGKMEASAGNILAVIAEILTRHRSNTTVHQCLLKLPGFSSEMVRKLETVLPTLSAKKQKDFVAGILSSACGSQLGALTPKDNAKKVTGVSEPNPRPKPAPSFFD